MKMIAFVVSRKPSLNLAALLNRASDQIFPNKEHTQKQH